MHREPPLSLHGHPTEGEGGLAWPATSIREVVGDYSEEVGRQARSHPCTAPGHRKSPAEAGLSSLRGLADLTPGRLLGAGQANPPIQYHSRLHTARENSHEAGLSRVSSRGLADASNGKPHRYNTTNGCTARVMPSLKGMNIEALMKLRNQVDERHLSVAIGVGGAIALAIIGYLLQWITS